MCGICGFYEYKTHRPAGQRVLSDMLQVIHHRGPDDSGVHIDKDLALGMRRLSIIDLGGGKQPITKTAASSLFSTARFITFSPSAKSYKAAAMRSRPPAIPK